MATHSRPPLTWACAALGALLIACSGGGDPAPQPVPPPTPGPAGLVSGLSPFPAGCGAGSGTNYTHSEVEPHLAVNPAQPAHMIGIWQQDRWSNGSARGLVAAVTFDGGATWTRQPLPFSRCGGGTGANGGDFERATDPWAAFAADGTAYLMSLSTSGVAFQGGANAMIVSRSSDGGRTWSASVPLILDTGPFFNDKNTLTADPTDARYVYAVWDRVGQAGGGPTMFARTTNGGLSWETARAIHDPGLRGQTIGNLVVVLSSGVLVNIFTELEELPDQSLRAYLAVIRSQDRGASWSTPIRITELLALGARDPETGMVIRDGSIIAQAAAGPDGSLALVWQDARFSAGARDGIAFSRSTDGGLTWSAPVRVNPRPDVVAFTPSVHIRPDGMIGVTYYDLRDNTASPATLPASYFLARSTNGVDWSETRLCEPFDLAMAPNAGGLFLGDYMALQSHGTSFVAFFARTTGELANRTDIHALRVTGATVTSLAEALPTREAVERAEAALPRHRGEAGPPAAPGPEYRRRVTENLLRRLPHWQHRPGTSRAQLSRPGRMHWALR